MNSLIHPTIRAEYLRWEAKLDLRDDRDDGVCVRRVLQAHFLIADYFANDHDEPISCIGPRDLNLLYSAVLRQHTEYDGYKKWTNLRDKIATLFFGIVKNHAFHDGNKRTAFLIVLDQIKSKLGRTLSVSKDKLELLTIRTAANELNLYEEYDAYRDSPDWQILIISRLLEKYTRKIHTKIPSVTFRKLNYHLTRFGYSLENPDGNKIGVFRLSDHQRIASTGFPGWTRQVPKGDMIRILKASGLTQENDYDYQVLFEGADHLKSLIREFREPLLRLADS